MKIKVFVCFLFLFLFEIFVSSHMLFIPEYELNKMKMVNSNIKDIHSPWCDLIYNKELKNYSVHSFIPIKDNKLAKGSVIEFIIAKFSSIETAEKSILKYEEYNNAIMEPPVEGIFSGNTIGIKNYVQGFGIQKLYIDFSKIGFNNIKAIPNVSHYNNLNLSNCDYCLYYIGIYVLLSDGWTLEIYQGFTNYRTWMGKLDPELLERLAKKGVEVYNAKKCNITIEPHKWNLNWSEENANPEGLINVWIAELEDGISVEDIDISTILLNGEVPVTKNVGYENNENFQGKILHLQFKKIDSFGTIFFPQKGDKREICIEGKLKNGDNFIGRTEIEIVGKEK